MKIPAVVSIVLVSTLILTACSKPNVTGVYELDISSRLADVPQTGAAPSSDHKVATDKARKANHITIDADHIDIAIGQSFQMKGTYRMDGTTIYVTPVNYVDPSPEATNIIAGALIGSPGWQAPERKPVYELYMPNDHTIMFFGGTFQRRYE